MNREHLILKFRKPNFLAIVLRLTYQLRISHAMFKSYVESTDIIQRLALLSFQIISIIIRYYTGSSTSWWHISNVVKIKMRQCISILIIPLDSWEKLFLFYNIGKSVVLIVYCQLLFLQSGRWFPSKVKWTGRNWILPVHQVFLMIETQLKIKLRTGTVSFLRRLKCNRKAHRVDAMDSVLMYV